MARFTAIYDACVLYPAPLRDLLMQLALSDLYRAKWTERIHAEWMRNLLANRPDLQRSQLERVRDLMDAHVRDSLVSGYEFLEASLDLPDPDDRHVLAAAIKAHADVIVTYNLNDFPESILKPLGLEAQHPGPLPAGESACKDDAERGVLGGGGVFAAIVLLYATAQVAR